MLALAWIFLGWQFALALVVGAIPRIAFVGVMAVIVTATYPEQTVEEARRDAASAGEKHAGMRGDPAGNLPTEWREKLRNREAWYWIGVVHRSEWGMVWKDLLVGFAVAGGVATWFRTRSSRQSSRKVPLTSDSFHYTRSSARVSRSPRSLVPKRECRVGAMAHARVVMLGTDAICTRLRGTAEESSPGSGMLPGHGTD